VDNLPFKINILNELNISFCGINTGYHAVHIVANLRDRKFKYKIKISIQIK